MPPRKQVSARPSQPSLPAARPEPAPIEAAATETSTSNSGRKKWIPKSPVEVVLEQITRQEHKVSGLREELATEERQLQKLQQAKKIFESL